MKNLRFYQLRIKNSYIKSILKILKPDNPIVTDLQNKISKKLEIKETLKYVKSYNKFLK